MVGRILNARFVPSSYDGALLVLRVGAGVVLFLRHGWEKVSTMSLMNPHFPDPLHIGHNLTWTLALLSDGICSLLIALGFATRWLSLYCFFNIFIAWALVHHFTFLGKGAGTDHGELIALYLVSFAALMVGGAGRYSIDAMLERRDVTSSQTLRERSHSAA